jgi:putative DNA primase/helicase
MSRARVSLRSRPDDWKIGLILNRHGMPLGNLRNVLHALHNAPEWNGVLAYDEFAERVITRRPPPWSDRTIEQWADDHDTRACVWFQDQGIPVTVGVVGRGIQTIARENPVHPVRDYLNALRWDGTPRNRSVKS